MDLSELLIISGGQAGADRAALDFAIEQGIRHGGYCPHGRVAEDGKLPSKYKLTQTGSSDPRERTFMNVRESDGTLVFYDHLPDEGTRLTIQYCRETRKPFFEVNLFCPPKPKVFRDWMLENNILRLNVAGSRESKSPGIYEKVFSELKKMILP
jgi:hypothetical protein